MTKKQLQRYFDCLPILIDFVKEMTNSKDAETRHKAIKTLHDWDKYRDTTAIQQALE